MKYKILKTELYSLFILSIVSIFYILFKNNFPDNSLLISSHSDDYYSITYYFSSILAEVTYYVGPWIVVPFFVFAFVYSFIITKRDHDTDVLISLLLICFFFFLFSMVAPSFLGKGLGILSQEFVGVYTSFFLTIIIGAITFYLTLRGAFFVLVSRLKSFLEMIGFKFIQTVVSTTTKSKLAAVEYKEKLNTSNLKNKTNDIIKTRIKELKGDKSELIEKVEISPLTNIPDNSNSIGDNKIIETSDLKITGQDSVELKNKKSVGKDISYNTTDLINCISPSKNQKKNKGPDSNYFNAITNAIEGKLAEFKLDGKIINILKGPVVDTFELELGAGVKVSKVTGLSDDIGLVLNGAPIRIVYPMRGRSTIGIEVPRNPRDFIYLDEVLKSKEFHSSNHKLPIAMGKDAFGEVKIVDLASMPHMLVAGATGAGKSVFINALLVSLIIKKSPRELRLILIDPKQLELAIYSDLPHLMLPVITDPKSSTVALLWAVQEMDRRYSILKELGVKNIDGFNTKLKTCNPALLLKINEYYEDEETEGYELPYIVIVIDEFADLILSTSGKEIELNVNRLAAKARAAGIHLVVATQRPSTDVVTGVVKANFPTRVAFRVATGHDSKTILDQYGAQKLLGKGDMLYKQGVDLLRMHSSFVDEDEVEELMEKLGNVGQNFNQGAIDFLESDGEDVTGGYEGPNGTLGYSTGTSADPMYQQALEIVYESGSASASMLQRRLRVGYNRAANLIEELEKNSIVGPAQGSKPRQVLPRPE
jgi:S-DNA-T family DNA segregation ATPase FtsK/SpoIIIE